MKNKNLLLGIIILQIGLLIGMFVSFFYPLWFGTAVKLRVGGYDPRDIFRGNYTQLSYNFSNLYLDSISTDITTKQIFRFGDEIYVELKPSKEGEYQPVGVWENPPQTENVLLKTTLRDNYYNYPYITLSAGIESYFSSPQRALALEKDLQNADSLKVFVIARITKGGIARIERIDYER